MSWQVYIVQCQDESLYTGISSNLDRRWMEHDSTHGAKYTRAHKPGRLIWSEEHPDRFSAQQREAQIKRWTRRKKLALASGDLVLLKSL